MSTPTTAVRVPLPGGGALDAALALPAGDGPHPGVLILHEAFGLNDDMRRIAGRFAAEGYVALAPDLWSQGQRMVCLTRGMLDPSGGFALDRIEAARLHLAERTEVNASQLAVIGFCMGGGFALAIAAKGGLRAAGVNYGRVPKRADDLKGICPVVASFGGQDRLFKDDAARLEQHLTALGVDHDVKLYDNVGHSFMSYDNAPSWMLRLPSPMRVGYSEAESEDAWKRILAFFDTYVRG